MGKAKKLKATKQGPKIALDKQIEDADTVKPKNRSKVRARKEDDEVSKYLINKVVFIL